MTHDTPARRRLCFPGDLRIRRHREFDQVMRQGVRVYDHRMTLWARPNDLDMPRLGLVVGKRHGNAVARNRLKRVIREAFRLSRPDLPVGLDLVASPSTRGMLDLASARAALLKLSKLAESRLRQDR